LSGTAWFKRAGVGVIAGLSATLGLSVLAVAAHADSTFGFNRQSGADRYGTACQIATARYNPQGTGSIATVLLADGLPGHQSDPLASPILEQAKGAPILLTDNTNTVPSNTMTCLSTNKVKNIIVIGGTNAVSSAQVTALQQAGYTVDNTTYAGTDRYDTARRIDETPGVGAATTGILASGDDNHLVDALGAGPLSYALKFPILVTTSTGCTIPAATQDVITKLGITKYIVVGGTAAIPACQYSGKNADTSATTGANRAATAELLAKDEVANYGGSNQFMGLAAGATYVGNTTTVQNDGADALASASLVGNAPAWAANNAVASPPTGSNVGSFIPLLVSNNPTDCAAAADFASSEKATLHGNSPLFGGQSPMPAACVNSVITAGGGTAPGSAGTVSSISPTSGPGGSTVTATFTGTPTSVTVSGCGLSNASTTPGSGNTTGGSTSTFSFTIPSNQAAGSCTLTFSATMPGSTTPVVSSTTFSVTGQGGHQALTSLPELVSAQMGTTVPANNNTGATPGTPVTYTFSQPVTSATASDFLIYPYNWDGGETSSCAATTTYTVSGPGNTAGGGALTATSAPKLDACSVTFTPGSNQVTAFYNLVNNTSSTTTNNNVTTTNSAYTVAPNYTLATVRPNAVTTASGTTNPDGSAAIGTAQTTGSGSFTANTTPAPDLRTVTFGTPSSANTAAGQTPVTFTFDQPAYVTNAAATTGAGVAPPPTGTPESGATAGFYLVFPDDSAESCSGPAAGNTVAPDGTVAGGGNGQSSVTVLCTNPTATGTAVTGAATPSSTAMTSSQVGRAFVGPDTVSSAALTGAQACPSNGGLVTASSTYCNPLQAAHQAGNGTLAASTTAGPNTSAPDLVSVTLEPANTSSNTTANDAVLYVFDQSLAAAGTVGKFGVFHGTNATSTFGGAATCAGPATCTSTLGSNGSGTNNAVLVYYPAGTLADATGAFVQGGAVTSTATSTPASQANQPDELGTTPSGSASTSITPGTVNAPQLVSVALSQQATGFGTQEVATYTFSHPVFFTVANVGKFHLYEANGDELTATSCSNGSTSATNTTSNANTTVVCSGYQDLGTAAAATQSAITSAVLGTVDQDAVTGTATGFTVGNPEGDQNT